MTSLHAAAGPQPLRLLISPLLPVYKLNRSFAFHKATLYLTHLCKHSRMLAVGHGRKADRAKCQRRKTAAWPQCCMVAYGWQCDMIGIPAVRHSDTEPGKRTNRPIFSERELMFMFAICHRPSVCLSSVTFVHPTQPIKIFGNVSAPFNTLVT